MPAFDGTGPCGYGPFTGKGEGYCVLRLNDDHSSFIQGHIGIQGQPFLCINNSGKEVKQMPRGDGTGPAGLGPMTGRAMGICAGYSVPGYMNPVFGRGFGIGGWGGRGRRNRFYATGLTRWHRPGYWAPYGLTPEYNPNPEQEIEMLKGQADILEKTLSEVTERLRKLESEKEKTSE